MTETAATERPRGANRSNGGGKRELGPVLVSSTRLAAHIGCTRQYIEQSLLPQGVVERNTQGLFDQDRSRLQYIQFLRSERERSPADAAHVQAKTEMLQLRLMEKRGELVPQSDMDALVDKIVGATLVGLSSLPARCAPAGDVLTRRNIERACFELRRDLSHIGQEMADKEGEPPLDHQRV